MPIPIYSSTVSSAASADAPFKTEWRGTVDTEYGTSANWTNGVPGSGDIALFNSGSVVIKGDDQSGITLDRMAHASELMDQIKGTGLPHTEVPVRIRYTDYSKAKGQGSSGAIKIVLHYLLGRALR